MTEPKPEESWGIYRWRGFWGWFGLGTFLRLENGNLRIYSEAEAKRLCARWNEQNTHPPGPCRYEARRTPT